MPHCSSGCRLLQFDSASARTGLGQAKVQATHCNTLLYSQSMLNFQGLKIDRQTYKKALSSDQALISGIRSQDRHKNRKTFTSGHLHLSSSSRHKICKLSRICYIRVTRDIVTSEFTLWTMWAVATGLTGHVTFVTFSPATSGLAHAHSGAGHKMMISQLSSFPHHSSSHS